MANNFIKQYVADKRTGANLVGIHVDTQSPYSLDRGTGGAMLSAIEEIAKRADEAKIKNEKMNLLLDTEEKNIQFEKEVLSNPLVYRDQKLYEEALNQFQQIRIEKEKMIAKSDYLTLEEKKLMVKRMKNNDDLFLKGIISERSSIAIQQQTNDLLANMDRKVAIASGLDINDIGGAEQSIEDLTELVDDFQGLTKISDTEATALLSKKVMEIETNKINNFTSKIVASNSLSIEQKRAKLNNLLNNNINDAVLDKIAEGYATQIKYTQSDEDYLNNKEYFKANLKSVYEEARTRVNQHLNYLKVDRDVDGERAKKEELKRINDLNEAYNSNSYTKILKAKTGMTHQWQDILNLESVAITSNNPFISPAYDLYGMGLKEINENKMYIKDFIPKEKMDEYNGQIEARMKDLKQSRFDATYEVLGGVIKDLPTEVGEAFLNSFASQNGEYQQNEYKIMIDGIKDPTNEKFIQARKFNALLNQSGKITSTGLSMAMQVPEITRLANKVMEKSKNKITLPIAYQTITQLYVGTNAITRTVPITKLPSDANYDDFLKEVLTSKNKEIKNQLIKSFGSEDEMIDTIVDLKEDRKILYPAPLIGGNN